MIATEGVRPARTRYRELDDLVDLPGGVSTMSLLDRDDRF